MLKQISVLSLIAGLAAGSLSLMPPAKADSAVSEDNAGNLFAYSSSRINHAAAGAIAACLNRGTGGCDLRGTAPNTRGWAAIAKGGGKVSWSYGKNTRSAAIQSALDGCPVPDSARIVLVYFDDSP